MASMDRAGNTAHVTSEDGAARNGLLRGRAATRPEGSRESQLHRVFSYVLLVYLFMYISRIPELIPWMHFGLILQPILLVGLFMTGETDIFAKVRPVRWLTAFTVWVAICVPFSFWPGGSFLMFLKTLQSLLMVAFIVAFVRSVRDVMRALAVVGLASGAIAVLSFVSSSNIGNRQGVGGSASLADPNFYALYLVVGVVCLCLTASQGRGWMRLCSILLIPIDLAGILRSGSRGGLATLLVGIVMFFAYGSTKQRIVTASACLTGILLAAFFLPTYIKTRFTDFFAPDSGQNSGLAFDADQGVTVAEASSEARIYLLQRSLVMTAKHPILGVGPDQFQSAEAADAARLGRRGAWHYTHNTYTQLSSELGVPGLILFITALFSSYRGLPALRKRGPTRKIRQMALFLQTGYVMLMVGAFFLSLGYGGLPFVLIGLSAVFQLAVGRDVRQTRARALSPEMIVAA